MDVQMSLSCVDDEAVAKPLKQISYIEISFQEAAGLELFNRALQFKTEGDLKKSEEIFMSVLETDLVKQVC